MDSTVEAIVAKFNVETLTYYSNEYWTVSVRPKQVTLGASLLIARRPVQSLADLTRDELVAMGDAAREMERRLMRSFAYEKINYLALMMEDPQVHFHVLPRYSSAKLFAGASWADPGWPKFPDMKSVVEVADASQLVVRALR